MRISTRRRSFVLAAISFAVLAITYFDILPGVYAAAAPCTAQSAEPSLPRAVVSVSMTVSDLERSIAFYTSVLGFEFRDSREDHGEHLERVTGVFGSRALTATLRLGQEDIELTEFLAPSGRPIPVDSRSNDHWFQHIAIVVSDIDRAYAHLREHRVRHASSGPQTLPATLTAAAGISAFYFKDPDAHVLEIIHFPQGKGDPRWQQNAGQLFLGIDHTAIVVSDTDASLALYRDALGMRVAGTSENFGVEQEHLNNVFGARLRITTLRAATGPGVELLEYLAPTDGRAAPGDSRATDLWHWHTTIDVVSIDDALTRAKTASAKLVSSTPQRCDATPPATVAMIRDIDGHALLLRQH